MIRSSLCIERDEQGYGIHMDFMFIFRKQILHIVVLVIRGFLFSFFFYYICLYIITEKQIIFSCEKKELFVSAKPININLPTNHLCLE